MLFQKKVDRALNLLKERNKEKSAGTGGSNENKELYETADDERRLELEKHDLAAMIIAALLVFAPILIFLFIILILVF